mgnify:FL=1
MLKSFRRHTKIIIWVVVVSFVIWGGYSVTTLKKEGRYAGEVFGKPVTFQEYNKFYNATQLFMPSKDRAEFENPETLRMFTWQNIIYAREAKNLGIDVTDEEVRGQVTTILTQQGLSNPTQEQYRIWLTRTLRISPREFEEGLREFMRIQKLIRSKLREFSASDTEQDSEDPAKASEEAEQKKQAKFMLWTNELNQKSRLVDYLALPEAEAPPVSGNSDPQPADAPSSAAEKG